MTEFFLKTFKCSELEDKGIWMYLESKCMQNIFPNHASHVTSVLYKLYK